jgi:hypothetical protein
VIYIDYVAKRHNITLTTFHCTIHFNIILAFTLCLSFITPMHFLYFENGGGSLHRNVDIYLPDHSLLILKAEEGLTSQRYAQTS